MEISRTNLAIRPLCNSVLGWQIVDTQPDKYHDRTGHIVEPENSKVYSQLFKTESYAEENKMKINYGGRIHNTLCPGLIANFGS